MPKTGVFLYLISDQLIDRSRWAGGPGWEVDDDNGHPHPGNYCQHCEIFLNNQLHFFLGNILVHNVATLIMLEGDVLGAEIIRDA